MVKSRSYYKTKEFNGFPQLSDFKIVEEEIDESLKEGEILTEALVISVDPFIRLYKAPLSQPIIGYQTARVLESKNEKYPKGCIVMLKSGWSTICKVTDEVVWYRVDTLLSEKVPITATVGAVGMPGMTAYTGLLEICKPVAGETVMVNGCAGAVGSVVGQIAKLMGCRVVGCCGSDEKCKFAKSIGFDAVFNYKIVKSWKEEIAKMAPNGIDCFFDNVGGQMASDVIHAMNQGGRVAVCGAISAYNAMDMPKADILQVAFILKHLTMRGFNVKQFENKFEAALKDMSQWITEGSITIRETVTDGFENVPQAFMEMLKGANIGKAVVKL